MKHYHASLTAIALFLIALFSASSAGGMQMKPFHTQNQSPLSHIFGLPSPGEAKVLTPGVTNLQFGMDLANNYVKDANARESILLDGETTRFGLTLRYGIRQNLEIGVEIPYLSQSGGFLDGFIINYHNAFGFPQGGRDQAPRDRLLFYYRKNNTDLLKVDQSGSGIGDIRLNAAWQLYDNPQTSRMAALRGSIKLPTGDSDRLYGSGSYDGALWLVAQAEFQLSFARLAFFGAAGMMGMTQGRIIRDQQNNWAGFGSIGVALAPLDWLTLKLQTDAHTPFFRNSDLTALGANAAQLVIGGTVALTKNISLDIGVSEDILVHTAPDVVFHFCLNATF